MIQIDLCYFVGCPSYENALQNLKTALEELGLEAEIRLVLVEDNATAEARRFLGSPSFQINGEDLWPAERKRYNLSCRVYATPQGMRGEPTVEMLVEKLRPFAHHP